MAVLGQVRDWVKSQDFFGHTITLNFDKNGDTHNTTIGGFFSIFIRSFIIWYVFMNLHKMVYYGNDNMQYTESLLNLNETGAISYSDTEFQMFMVLRNLNYGRRLLNKTDADHMQPIFLDEDVERYIQILFIQS